MTNGRGGFRGARKDRTWLQIPWLTPAPLVAADATGFASGGISATAKQTIARVRGLLRVFVNDAATAAGDSAMVGIGLGVVPTDLFVAVAPPLPDPISDPGYPWLFRWVERVYVPAPDGARTAWGSNAWRVEVDAKAMRKISPDQTLAWIYQYSNDAGNPIVAIDVSPTRVLVLT